MQPPTSLPTPLPTPLQAQLQRQSHGPRQEPSAAQEALQAILADLEGAPVTEGGDLGAQVAALVRDRLGGASAGTSVEDAIVAAEAAALVPAKRGRAKAKAKPRVPRNAPLPAKEDGGETSEDGDASAPPRATRRRPAAAKSAAKEHPTRAKVAWESAEVAAVPLPDCLEALASLFAEVRNPSSSLSIRPRTCVPPLAASTWHRRRRSVQHLKRAHSVSILPSWISLKSRLLRLPSTARHLRCSASQPPPAAWGRPCSGPGVVLTHA